MESVKSLKAVDSMSLGLQMKYIVPGTILTNSTRTTRNTSSIAALYGDTDLLQQELERLRFSGFSGN
jgi:hypothetical protein